MSDETTRTDDGTTADASSTAPGVRRPTADETEPQYEAARPVGFCQDCGRALTSETLRAVGRGVFCEPCLETRLRQATGPYGAAQGWDAAGSGAAGPDTAGVGTAQGYAEPQPGVHGTTLPPPIPATTSEPNPVLAACLGLIPGVGAMYNGQFAKGIIHLIIFAILVSLTDNVNGIFGLFVAGWIVYQAFEAYHTAVARRDLLPLPNAFGFNDIGERMGFDANWGGQAHVKPGQQAPRTPPPVTSWAADGARPAAPVQPASTRTAATVPPTSGPPTSGPDWAGYVPPTGFAQAGARQQAVHEQATSRVMNDTGYQFSAYAPTFTGDTPPASYATDPYVTAPPVAPAQRFPAGALWLIGLGLVILLGNLVPDWRIDERWLLPLLFAGLSIWLFTRRLQTGVRIACIIRWPVLLMVLAILFALHAAYFAVTFGMMTAVLLIALGAVLVVERTLGATPLPAAAGSPAMSADPADTAVNPAYVPAAEPVRATFTAAAPTAGESMTADDSGKDGQ